MSRSPFVVNVAALLQRPGSRRPEHRRGTIGGLAVTGSCVPSESEVEVSLELEAVPGAVIARGTVRAPWEGQCRRCLAPTGGTVLVEVQELFDEAGQTEETYGLVGDQIDLEPLARDAVLLDLPLAPLCRELCQGLCPRCGADLNLGSCGCSEETADPRWAALDALKES